MTILFKIITVEFLILRPLLTIIQQIQNLIMLVHVVLINLYGVDVHYIKIHLTGLLSILDRSDNAIGN